MTNKELLEWLDGLRVRTLYGPHTWDQRNTDAVNQLRSMLTAPRDAVTKLLIDVKCGEEMCLECPIVVDAYYYCPLFGGRPDPKMVRFTRHPDCLKAEKLAKRLREKRP